MRLFLIIFLYLSPTTGKIYEICELAEELYVTHKLAKEDIGYHLCIARSKNAYNTVSTGDYLGLYGIGAQWWCGEDDPGGHCNVECSSLIDDDITDDVKCAQEIIRLLGVGTWGFTREICDSDFINAENCLKNITQNSEVSKCPTISSLEMTKDDESCGKPYLARGTIIGGHRLLSSQRGLFPWISALIYTNNEFFCGGVIISKNRVLTAAHCILPKGSNQQLFPKDIRTLLGVYNLDDPFEIGRSVVAIEKIRMHPDWNPNTQRYEGDIAVLNLEINAQFNRFIQPICLIPTNANVLAFTEGTVVGYGIGSTTSMTSEKIPKILNLPIHKNEDCYRHNKEFAGISSSNTFCAGSGEGSGVCLGDSGSGLYLKYEGVYYLRGIVSASFFTSEGICNVNDYALFTSVYDYSSWINQDDDFRSPSVVNASVQNFPFRKLFRNSDKITFV